MLREEAIEWLKKSNPNNILSISSEEHRDTFYKRQEAFDMAIKALEQEPCDDCISRQDVFEQIDQWAIGNREYLYTNAMHYLTKRIQDIPPVTPQPKIGHWIIKDGKEQGYDIAGVKTWYIQIMCDKCGFIKTTIEGHTGQYKYCPNCGQPKMVEPQAEKGNE